MIIPEDLSRKRSDRSRERIALAAIAAIGLALPLHGQQTSGGPTAYASRNRWMATGSAEDRGSGDHGDPGEV